LPILREKVHSRSIYGKCLHSAIVDQHDGTNMKQSPP